MEFETELLVLESLWHHMFYLCVSGCPVGALGEWDVWNSTVGPSSNIFLNFISIGVNPAIRPSKRLIM